MKILLFFISLLLFPEIAFADNVILMIGDGMGKNHIACTAKDKPLFLATLPIKGKVHTESLNSEVTDSAASATAYSCGQKTNNYFLGKLSNEEDCLTIAEEAVREGYAVGIYSNDEPTGATPSAFYAHTNNRNDKKTIEKDREKAAQVMDIAVGIEKISDEIEPRLQKLFFEEGKIGFFAMFEGAKIDKKSHENDFEAMKVQLRDFDRAVKKASEFVQKSTQTTLIVLADHETGGLTNECVYTTNGHTGQDIPVYAEGKHAALFEGEQDNTDIYKKMKKILFFKE